MKRRGLGRIREGLPTVALAALAAFGALLAACSHSAREAQAYPDAQAEGANAQAPQDAGREAAQTAEENPAAGNAQAATGRESFGSKALIRLHNLSDSLPLTQVLVQFPADSAHIGFIAPRAYSDYFAVDSAYRYAFIRARSGGRTYYCQPADYTGESLLAPGRYTYELSQVRNRNPQDTVGFFVLELLEDKGHP
jgi:hypothetical protein